MRPENAASRPTLLLLALVALACTAPPAAAQSEGSGEDSHDATPAQQLADAPDPGAWAVSATLGFQIKDGITDTRGYDVDAILAHSTGGGALLRLDFEYQRAEFRPPSGGDLMTVDNREYTGLTVVPSWGDRLRLMGVASFERDDPVGLEHRAMAQGGFYFQIHQSPTLQIMVAPLVGGGTQDNARSGSSDGLFNLGGIQSLTWHPNRTSTVEWYLKGHRDLDESDDFALDFNASVAAQMNSHLGLKVYYKYSLEGIHSDDRGDEQHQIGGGLTIKFPGG